jgi:hypothetical protein
MEGMPYFEGQNSKDCVIHSINNAFGKEVVTKDQVLKHIEDKVQKLKKTMEEQGLPEDDIAKRTKRMKTRYSSGRTFFAADIVWDTVKSNGVYHSYVTIPGFSSPYIKLSSITPEVAKKPIVILGGDNNGGTHAIAVRNGMILDSERAKEGAVPLNLAELKKSIPKVFGAYVFLDSPQEVAMVKRASLPNHSWYVE